MTTFRQLSSRDLLHIPMRFTNAITQNILLLYKKLVQLETKKKSRHSPTGISTSVLELFISYIQLEYIYLNLLNGKKN